MELTEVKFEDLSDISYRIFLHKYPRIDEENLYDEILVIEFTGTHGMGSKGNNDSLFMASIVKASMTVWYAEGLVLDFRGLAYTWGNSIGNVLLAGKKVRTRAFPTSVAVSSSCKSGLEGAYAFYGGAEGGDQTKWLFDDLDSAVSYIKELIELSRNQPRTEEFFWRL